MKKKLFTLLTLLLCLCSGAWGQTLIEVDNMETTSGSGSSLTVSGFSKGDCTISQSTEARTGSYSLKSEYNGNNDKTVKTTNTSISVAKNDYLHCIGWAKLESSDETAESTSTQAATNSYVGGNGKGTYVNLTTSWKQITSVKKASSNQTSCYVLLQRKHAASKAVLFDDVVIYISSNSTTDIDAPTAATSANATTSAISWTSGTDANTGIQKTLIFKRTSGSSDNLTLNNQAVYPLEGPSTDQSGNWTLVAVVNGDATSYEAALDESTRYAIVHRDLAYNYSTPTYVSTPAPSGSHTITLNANGGSGNGTAMATEGSATLTSITAPVRDGYTLEGYYAETTCENKVATAAGALQPSTAYTNANSEWTSTSDEMLYAKWEAVELANTAGSKTWTFDDTNITSGSKQAASSSTEYVYSSLSGMTFGANFDATALSFKGSYPYYSSGGQHISQGSQWKFHPTVDGRVKVSWYSAGGAEDTRYLSIGGTSAGSTNNTKVTSDAVAVSADADVVIAGYSDESLQTAAYIDVTEIVFTETPYTLTYNSNGATSGSVPETAKKYAEGDEVTVLGNTGTLEKTGKTFVGWNTQADGLGTDYAADAVLTIGTADVTLYAKWTSEYTVTHTLTNVTKTSGETTAYENTQYTAVYAAASNYDLPEAITVTAGGSNITASCTWTKATGTVVIPAAQVTGNIEITVTGVEHVAPTAGVIFSLKVTGNGYSNSSSEEKIITDVDVTGGTAYGYGTSDRTMTESTSNGLYFAGNVNYIKIVLDDPLLTGDVITFVNGDSNNRQICFNNSPSQATDNTTISNTYTWPESMNNSSTIYIYRTEAKSTYVKSLTITRKNSITLNNVSGAAYGFSTFCSPKNFTVTGATAYKASLDEGKLTLTALEGIIPANAGVILAADKGATASIAYTSSAATADMDGNALGGTTARTLTATLKGDNTYFYAFQNTTNTFKQYNGEYFPANKAYVVSNALLSRGISMDFGETTGISNVDVNANDNFDVNAPMYNLAGQKVGKSYKGIVIVNGKKVVRK